MFVAPYETLRINASPFTGRGGGYISIDLRRQRNPGPQPGEWSTSIVDRIAEVGTGPRDRRSKYWDTGTLSPRFSSVPGLSSETEKKKRGKKRAKSRWRKERTAACCSARIRKILPDAPIFYFSPPFLFSRSKQL